MNTQETIKELSRAGKAAEVKALLDRCGVKAGRTYAEIRADETVADSHRVKLLAAAQVRARREVDYELEQMARRVVKIDHNDAGKVFGVDGLPGDVASLAISRRDAGDRVAGITDQAELANLLRRATRTGDEVLARAIAERATELQQDTVMNQFLADRPNLDAAGTRLWNAERAQNDTFAATLGLANLRAHELQGMAAETVEQLADEAGEAPAPQPARHIRELWLTPSQEASVWSR